MGTFKFKHLFCFLLAAIMLAATAHHSLCDLGFIDCPPCQTENHGGSDDEDCPACVVSHLMVKVSSAPAKSVIPVVALYLLSDDFTALLMPEPKVAESILAPLDFISPQKRQCLRDLVQSTPIRGPSQAA